jgi:hypothetical protein
MKKLLLATVVVGSFSWATDFASMTTSQLLALRGKVPASQRAAFRAEMQKRLSSMTLEQRRALMSRRGQGRRMGQNR